MLNNKKAVKRFRITVLIIFSLLFAGATYFVTDWLLSLREPDKFAAFRDTLSSLGVWGFLLLILIQYIQIVVAFIPGGPIQIVAGILFGSLGGLAVCLTGTLLASLTVFPLVKKIGHKAIALFVNESDIQKYSFVNNSKKLEFILLLLFFIPGTPKDALTYIFALTPIKTRRFIFLSVTARLPAMVTSIFAGESVSQGEWVQAAALFAVISVVSLLGLILHRKLLGTKH